MRKLIIWGAGRIGRGFVADIFFDTADFDVVFVDVDKELVDALNKNGRYLIAKATRDGINEGWSRRPYEAVHTSDSKRLSELFETDELLLDIAVHEPKVSEVADMLVPLFELRQKTGKPMDVMMNVNMARPDRYFRNLMQERLSGEYLAYFNEKVGVTGIFAMCISPLAPDWLKEKDPLALWNNGYFEQAISVRELKCTPPALPRLRLTEDIEKEETRKLYTLNMAHGLLCYLGLPLGLKTSAEAVGHPVLRPILEGALKESCAGLCREFGFESAAMEKWQQDIIALLENPYIEDGLQRLGADTRRKLGAYDREVGPARLAVKAGVLPVNLAKAVKAGFEYENPDEGTQAVRAFYKENGLAESLKKFCALEENDPLFRLISEA